MKNLTLGSLFDGIGGFPFAAVLSGVTPIWASEIEPFCIAVTKQRFPNMQHLGSVTDINGAEIPPVDIISFGSPCQDLSIAGQRKGLDGERSGLFKEAIRIIYEMRNATNGKYPKYIIWENVPGAFSSNKGDDFQTVLEEITKTDIPMPSSGKWSNAGMVRSSGITAAWRMLDAQYWGVPQRRKRIYLVGSFGSDCAATILFKRDSVQRYLTPCKKSGKEASRNIGTGIERSNQIFDARGNGDGYISPAIVGDHCSRVNDYAPIVVEHYEAYQHHGYRKSDIAGTMTSAQNDHVRGDTPLIVAGGIKFDDITTDTDGHKWTQICKSCKEKYNINDSYICEDGSGICGVEGCDNEADFYLDFPSISYINDVFCLQGNMIGREDKNGPQGSGINKDVSFTVNTIDRHAVAYRLPVTLSDKASTLRAGAGAPKHEQDFVGRLSVQQIFEDCWHWIVRRLTPLECERLQGYPDFWTCLPKIEDISDDEYEAFKNAFIFWRSLEGKTIPKNIDKQYIIKWYNKLDSDASRYKSLGNSLAIPCALRVVGYIADYERSV